MVAAGAEAGATPSEMHGMNAEATDLKSTTELLHLFADPTRVRLIVLLEREELSVAELQEITELGQSRVSTHLGRLREAGLLRDRRVGASTFYSMTDGNVPAPAKRLWELLRGQVRDGVLESDRKRCEAVLRARDRGWPEAMAGQMERHYSPGRTWESLARGLLGLISLGDVLDVGCGDGLVATLLVDRARSYVGLDRSERVIEAARARAPRRAKFVVGDMHDLPFESRSFDDVLMFHVLTYAHEPWDALEEAQRVLRPGGRLSIATLAAHEHEDVTASYGHVQPGIDPKELRRALKRAGFAIESCGVATRERRPPHFEVLVAVARTPSVPVPRSFES